MHKNLEHINVDVLIDIWKALIIIAYTSKKKCLLFQIDSVFE